jgi:hypothetical protein
VLPGDFVLLKEGSNPLVSEWTKAKVLKTYKSEKDDNVRSVLVDVEGKQLQRDISRISILDGPVTERRKGLTAPSGGVCRIARLPTDAATAALRDGDAAAVGSTRDAAGTPSAPSDDAGTAPVNDARGQERPPTVGLTTPPTPAAAARGPTSTRSAGETPAQDSSNDAGAWAEVPAKRGRGRPKKTGGPTTTPLTTPESAAVKVTGVPAISARRRSDRLAAQSSPKV